VVGAKDVMVGAGINVKPANEAVPPGVVRLTAPVEPELTRATIEVADTTVNVVTGVPPSVTMEVPFKLVPVILISAPAPADVGAKEVMVGAGINVNPANDAVPPGVVRLTAPDDPVPTMATMEVADTTVKEVTGVPPNVITDVLLKLVPVIESNDPAAAVLGVKAVIVGAGINVKPAKDAVPPGVVRLTAPVEPVPTIATIEVADTTVNADTVVPPSVTIEVPLKFVPVILMTAPAAAVVGAKDVIVGAGMNVNPSNEAVPPGVVRLTAPDDPLPTMATIEVADTTVNADTVVPPNVTMEVPLKFVPVILMSTPAAAVVGAKVVIVGAGINVKPANDAVPPGVVKLTAPDDPVPTMATIEVADTTVNVDTGVPPNVMAYVLSK
jgi:biotin-(acetyl-CoA carboxylase) ligase